MKRILKRLEEEYIDERHDDDSEYYGVKPIEPDVSFLPFLVLLLPEHPFHLVGDVMVKDDGKAEEPPIIPEPDHPQHIENGPEAHPYPFVVVCFPQAHFSDTILQN